MTTEVLQTTLGKICEGPDKNGNIYPIVEPWMQTGLKIISDHRIKRKLADGTFEPLMEIVLINNQGHVHPEMFEKIAAMDVNSEDMRHISIRRLTAEQFLSMSFGDGIPV